MTVKLIKISPNEKVKENSEFIQVFPFKTVRKNGLVLKNLCPSLSGEIIYEGQKFKNLEMMYFRCLRDNSEPANSKNVIIDYRLIPSHFMIGDKKYTVTEFRKIFSKLYLEYFKDREEFFILKSLYEEGKNILLYGFLASEESFDINKDKFWYFEKVLLMMLQQKI